MGHPSQSYGASPASCVIWHVLARDAARYKLPLLSDIVSVNSVSDSICVHESLCSQGTRERYLSVNSFAPELFLLTLTLTRILNLSD